MIRGLRASVVAEKSEEIFIGVGRCPAIFICVPEKWTRPVILRIGVINIRDHGGLRGFAYIPVWIWSVGRRAIFCDPDFFIGITVGDHDASEARRSV